MEERKIRTTVQTMVEDTMPPLIVLKMELNPSREMIQGLHSNTMGEVDTLFDMFEEEFKRLRKEWQKPE